VRDDAAAINVIQRVGYFRLLPYFRVRQVDKKFRPNTEFEDIHNIYLFDRKLRLLCLDAIERIEVALRASINNGVVVKFGPHFYLNNANFERLESFERFLAFSINKGQPIIGDYFRKYNNPEAPPIWMVLESVPFGQLSRLFQGLKTSIRNVIARDFGYSEKSLVSWFRCISSLRNRCAHHERIWNARMVINPPSRARQLRELTSQQDFYARAVLMTALLRRIEPGETWRDQLKDLILPTTVITPDEMGFPPNWDMNPFWV